MAAAPDHVPFTVDGKSAIVTGAGSGINFEFAKLLLSRNCNVLIADLGLRPEAKELVDAHSSKDGGKARAVFLKTNVVIWDDLTRMFDEAEKEFGKVDLVCPGAGVFEPHWSNFWIPPSTGISKDTAHGTPSDGIGHYATLDINLTHPIRTTQLAISRWLNPSPSNAADKVSPTNPKRIVHISSIAGQVASGLAVPLYTASKHAISGFIRSLRDLDTLGIRVNGVAPGIIKTPLWTEHPEKLQMLDEEADAWVGPDEVAAQMLRCAEDPEVGAGVVWEVLKGAYRVVSWRNDPGPQGPGSSVSRGSTMTAEALGLLSRPGWGVPSE